MYCPKCHTEYRPEISRCPDCNVDLIDALPVDEEIEEEAEYDPNARFVEIFATASVTDVALIKSVLDSEGIHYFVTGETTSPTRHVTPISIKVLEEEAEQVSDLLMELDINSFQHSV